MIGVRGRLVAGRVPEAAVRWLGRFLAQAPADPSIVAVIGTGSAVRPVDTSQDLDLLVVYTGQRPTLRPAPPVEVDVRFQAVDGIEDEIAAGREYLLWAIAYGKPLLDRHGVWERTVTRWRERLPLPPIERSLGRARRASKYAAELRDMGDHEAAAEQTLSALTHLAWARLVGRGVLPASRPEIPEQLRRCGDADLADELERALVARPDPWEETHSLRGRRRPQLVAG